MYDFEFAVINALLYIVMFGVYWFKHKDLDLFSSILLAYVMVAVFGCYLIYSDKYTYTLSLFNFVYLFVCIMIFIWPFRYAKFTSSNITIVDNRWINILFAVYFVTGAVALIYSLPRTMALVQMGDWNEVRNELYADSESVELYSSPVERLMKNIYSYLSPFGIVMVFYQFTKKKFNILLTVALLFVWGGNAYCNSTVVASRGMVVFLVLNLVLIFLIFRKSIPKKRKKLIYILGIGFIIFFATYLIAVSQSRFEDEAGDSAIWYLGQAMNVFNQDIMASMHDYADGKYFFKFFLPWFDIKSEINMQALGATHGTQFMTFVGCFYIDFGPVITLLIGLFMCWLLMKFTHKKHYYLSDLIIIAYFANWYINGALVVGRGQALSWIMVFVVYFIVRTIETRKTKKICA